MAEEIKEVDAKGVPLENRMREFERKMEEKYAKDLEQTRAELAELKQMRINSQNSPQPNIIEKNDPKERLQQFVADPDAYIQQQVFQREFQRQIPEAEAFWASKPGYSKDMKTRLEAIIFANKLNTVNHMPMERAQIAWKLYENEANAAKTDTQRDEERREAAIKTSGGEGSGKRVPKDSVNIHNELIKKLAAAEKSGDIDASIKYMDMLQDHPMENTVLRGP